MDRSVYIAMTGATQTMRAQDAVSHDLANASTVGFKSALSAFKSMPVLGDGAATRINAVAQGIGKDYSPGAIQATGRSLDVAVNGSGWIAVQATDGSEAYTRAGNLQLGSDGSLTDGRGNPVQGSGGPITVPDSARLRRVRVVRDYSMFDRREAPQYYDDVKGRETKHPAPAH